MSKWPFPLPVPWAAAGQELRDNPGEWRHAASYFNRQSARVTASAIRRDAIRGLAPLGRFDAEHRVVDGEYRVYVRYVGPGSTSPEPGPSVAPAIPERADPWCPGCEIFHAPPLHYHPAAGLRLDGDGLTAEPTKGGTE